MRPIEVPDEREFVRRMPPAAVADMMEWLPPGATPERFVRRRILEQEWRIDELGVRADVSPITDDRPINEYFFLRRHVFRATSLRY